ASGSHDLKFTLFAAPSGGTPIAGPVCADNVDILNGLFTVQLDFGPGAFNGDARWIEIAVRADSTPGNCASGVFTTLSPRSDVTALPYAQFALRPWATSGGNITTTNAGNVGVGVPVPASKLSVGGTIESTSGGVKFPDGS